MADGDFWLRLGLNMPDMLGGFFGGVVNAFVMRRSDPVAIIGSVVVGALAANYLSGSVGHYLGTSAGTSGFLVGVSGMVICQGIIEAASKWKAFGPRTGGADGKNP